MTEKEKKELKALEAIQMAESIPRFLFTELNDDGTFTIDHDPIRPPLKRIMTREEIEALPGVEKWYYNDYGTPEDYQQ